MVAQLPQVSLKISPLHLAEWVKESGVSEAITRLNVQSLTDRTIIGRRLGWKKYLDKNPLGWWVSGLDLSTMKLQSFGQFKPDEPVVLSAEDEDGAKYITAKGGYDAIALQHTEKDFWQRVLDDPSIPVPPAEGTKKAGALMTCGYASLAVCGVEMGLRKGKLVPNLAAVAVQGRPIPLVFDMDILHKKEVQLALKKLATVLVQRGCIVTVAMWNPELGVKIDDVKANHGPEMVKKIMADAIPYSQWLKNLEAQMGESGKNKSNKKASSKPPSARKIAAKIAEQYASSWKFDDEQKTWRIWTGKHWEKTGIGAFTSLLKTTLDARNINYTGSAYIEDVRKLLEYDLRQVRWQTWDVIRYISFKNCVLDTHTGSTLQHSPGMGFTAFLPYEYKPLEGDLSNALEALRVNCPSINKFFRTAMQDDERKIFKLLAITNGIIKRRFHDLQMFVHFAGAPGGGKGTTARLMQKVVGRDNFKGCQLERLSDGSTRASVVDKQLVVFPDERKPVGIDSILSFTGGDVISYRELHTPAADAFFYGCFLICSNKPIFVGDTTGLDRRLCLVHFDNPIPTEKHNHAFEDEFDAEIPALIAIALSLPDFAVTQAIRGKGASQIVEFKAKEWEMKVETSSVAAFFDAELVLDPASNVPVGKLYDAYKCFCEDGGLSKFSIVKFPRLLADLLADEKLSPKRHQGRVAYFEGLRIRRAEDSHPTHSQTLADAAGVDAGVSGSLAGVGVGVKPLPDIHQRELRELDTKVLAKNENDDCLLGAEESENDDCSQNEGKSNLEIDLPLATPATPANPLPMGNITPAPTPAKLVQSTLQTPAQLNEDERDLVEMIRIATAEPDPESARRAAADILPILKDVCANGAANREKVWAALTDSERARFSELTTKPISNNSQEPELPQPVPEPEIIAPADAEKLREIAIVWWPELYPAQMQSLLAQMYAWGAPGALYDAATITAWLAGEDAVTRKRISELMQRR
ncbi:DUF3854 domain-containing protein [Microcoleus sp. MOSTC5]|uniref:DUF3854 domain-containing protein n=1 Tax=Microcoleus sp. MOSTC5 TaxID=3055378 RepID=UPI002FD3F8F9